MKQILIVERLFDGESFHKNMAVTIDAGKITAVIRAEDVIDVEHHTVTKLAGTLTPGFIDVQVNGGGGALFNAEPSTECIEIIGRAHARFGTTGFLPTLITDDVSIMTKAADTVAVAIANQQAGVLGIHFEGPHLSVPKKGVHPQRYIRQISERELSIFSRQDLGIKVVTLAPENVSTQVIKALVSAGVKVCLGHSNADYDTVNAALEAGATGFTHLYNAMSALGSREPGMVGAALESQDAWCGLIVDGHHVHPAAAKIAINAKPKGKVMLVTDAMPPVGMSDDASFKLFGTQVTRQGDRLNAATGELAGCVLDMVGAVNNSVAMLGLCHEEALLMASLYPATFLGLEQQLGLIKPGYRADLVLLNPANKVSRTYIAGNVVFAQ
ncbi:MULTISPECIES: N-acetylglucosamine-6-phosphate deacetylase [Shewanella]|uniref:N-acetylglucosamine-6-phosphate deacetylase n=1 Tax=Shewanella TaxID=22 RepID=UPI000C623A46|nr:MULTISPECIES: N-acetylglucosamine-6-phosphate deacetylase [Shewanella]NCQ44579.1 N-acetylglucosamine-6-phosphate deacetylase [Shewanella frigidimarina]NCO72242.1 N-acetylglucosamine-6-phosphate deacetylase [Shewanella vesiculosa]NCP35922.1 N-acetylglucosamine-6-phosphate deacetylase [Shewanella vesiculosa]NCP68691.1 N-acetylglucosamine-6-phosphate deacetylase [Shewanella vesiculosa]NCP73586.1 N-acetylglucosamine-6-phosphate deacetylase [Shewanella vesiculosa]